MSRRKQKPWWLSNCFLDSVMNSGHRGGNCITESDGEECFIVLRWGKRVCEQRLDTLTDFSVFKLEMPSANESVSPFRSQTGLSSPETIPKNTVYSKNGFC